MCGDGDYPADYEEKYGINPEAIYAEGIIQRPQRELCLADLEIDEDEYQRLDALSGGLTELAELEIGFSFIDEDAPVELDLDYALDGGPAYA
jgi:hypothetical protein